MDTKTTIFFNIANDAVLLDQSSKLNCSSQINWSKEDYIERFEIQKNNSIFEKIKNKNFSRCWINATTGQHVPRYHPDAFKPDSLTILYYVNLKWDIDWDGQTIWRTDDMQNIEYISDFIPGRICIFDSSIPHKGCVPNNDAPTFRFTLNSVWE